MLKIVFKFLKTCDLTPLEIYTEVKPSFLKNLERNKWIEKKSDINYINSRHELFDILIRSTLSIKRIINEYKLDKLSFEYILSTIQQNLMRYRLMLGKV